MTMTVEEIFSQVAQHMVEGLMFHSQLSDYYGFLGLDGYKECHKYHYFIENSNYKKITDYYLHHYNKFILDMPFKNPGVIPDNWYKYTRQDVDSSIKKGAIQTGIERWVGWEKQTKTLYEQMYQALIDLNEIAGAIELKKYIEDVDNELAHACQKHIELKSIEFNLDDIIMKQDEIYKKYKKKLKEIEL